MTGNRKGNGQTVFRRINGRIVPVSIRREASAVMNTTTQVATKREARGSVAKAFGYGAAGLGLAFGAGRLKHVAEGMTKVASTVSQARVAGALDRTAKVGDFASKFGVGSFVGHELTKLDRTVTADEKSKLMNIGSTGVGPLQIALGLTLGYGGYRLTKRFQKWGYRGGAFPVKLNDL